MNENSKKRNTNYDRVMSRVRSRSQSGLTQNSNVIRHEIVSSIRVGAKLPASNVSSGVFSDLPTILNDYVPQTTCSRSLKQSSIVKPKRTVKSLDPSKSPPRPLPNPKHSKINRDSDNTLGSVPLLRFNLGNWSDTHNRKCYSSRSHNSKKLQELKDEIKAYSDIEKLTKLHSQVYKKCGVVLNDVTHLAEDKAVQAEIKGQDKEKDESRFPREPSIKEKWIDATGRKNWFPSKNSSICSAHFLEDDFNPITKYRKLVPGSCPTINIWKPTKEINQEIVYYGPTPYGLIDDRVSDSYRIEVLERQLRRAKTAIDAHKAKIKCLRERNRRQQKKIDGLQNVISLLKSHHTTGINRSDVNVADDTSDEEIFKEEKSEKQD